MQDIADRCGLSKYGVSLALRGSAKVSEATRKRVETLARKLGYENAQVLAGGLKAWKDAGLPVEKS